LPGKHDAEVLTNVGQVVVRDAVEPGIGALILLD
jgi:hypothetical protein